MVTSPGEKEVHKLHYPPQRSTPLPESLPHLDWELHPITNSKHTRRSMKYTGLAYGVVIGYRGLLRPPHQCYHDLQDLDHGSCYRPW